MSHGRFRSFKSEFPTARSCLGPQAFLFFAAPTSAGWSGLVRPAALLRMLRLVEMLHLVTETWFIQHHSGMQIHCRFYPRNELHCGFGASCRLRAERFISPLAVDIMESRESMVIYLNSARWLSDIHG